MKLQLRRENCRCFMSCATAFILSTPSVCTAQLDNWDGRKPNQTPRVRPSVAQTNGVPFLSASARSTSRRISRPEALTPHWWPAQLRETVLCFSCLFLKDIDICVITSSTARADNSPITCPRTCVTICAPVMMVKCTSFGAIGRTRSDNAQTSSTPCALQFACRN